MAKKDKRKEIIQAALELIGEHGFHGAPMSMIASKAGVGAGTIYRYFENKDQLITELYDDLEADILVTLQENYPARKPLRERYVFLLSRLMRHFIENPLVFRYLEQFYNSPYGIVVRREKLLQKGGRLNLIGDLFFEGIEQQILKDLPLVILYSLAFGFMSKVVQDHIQGFIVMDDELITKAIEASWDAIKR